MADAIPGAKSSNGPFGYAPVALAAGIFAWLFSFVGEVSTTGPIFWVWDWVPSLGITLSFLLDGLSLTFGLLISGIGVIVLLYSNTYLAGHPQYGRFALYLTAFMLSMLGVVLAGDLILVFVFWELTTFTSYLLIGFSHDSAKSRRNALQALFVTGAGGLAFLAGLILLGLTAGTTSIPEVIAKGEELRQGVLYLPILILLLCGAFTKSAQVPFHFWLPNAMAAPTPVSAFLHSATMVKAGVYFLARMHPALADTNAWFLILTCFGAVTAVWASLLAMRQTDLKQALAYTTLMALGTLVLLLGQTSGYAMTAFATFLIVHSLYKACLFLVVGCVDHATGTREAGVLGGLAKAMPITATIAALAALSMAGLPPFLGFIAKELQYYGGLDAQGLVAFIIAMGLAANALMFAVAGVVAFKPFWRPGGETPKTPTEAPWQMWIGPAALAALGLVLGLAPALIQDALIAPIVASLTGDIGDTKTLKLWAGVNLPLILSLATFAIGFVLYLTHVRLRAALEAIFSKIPSLDVGWDSFLAGLKGFAAWQTRHLQSGRLSRYLVITFTVIAVGPIATIWAKGVMPPEISFEGVTWLHLSMALLITAGSLLAAVTNSRITGIACLGVVGIGTALAFIIFSAPDVAITQLLVETLVVVLVSVVMLRLPLLTPITFRPGHVAISVGVGAAVTLILLAVVATPLDLRLTEYFEATSWPKAYGQNIVNVILVDFRAIDTFGEIAVVVVAALSAYALLRTTRGLKS